MRPRTAHGVVSALAVGGALVVGCTDAAPVQREGSSALVTSSAPPPASGVDLAARVGERVEVETQVVETIDAQTVVVSGGQLDADLTLVTTDAVPPGLVPGQAVRVVGQVLRLTPSADDPYWNELKRRPVIAAESISVR